MTKGTKAQLASVVRCRAMLEVAKDRRSLDPCMQGKVEIRYDGARAGVSSNYRESDSHVKVDSIRAPCLRRGFFRAGAGGSPNIEGGPHGTA